MKVVKCGSCGAEFKVFNKFDGSKARCVKCGGAIVPAAPDPQPPPAAEPPALAEAPVSEAPPPAPEAPPPAPEPPLVPEPPPPAPEPPPAPAPAPEPAAPPEDPAAPAGPTPLKSVEGSTPPGRRPIQSQLKQLMFARVADIGVVRFATSDVTRADRAQELGDELMLLVQDMKVRLMVINFENVKHMSSMVIGKLVRLLKFMRQKGGTVKLCCIDANVREIFRIMRMDKLVDIFDTEEEAVRSFKGRLPG